MDFVAPEQIVRANGVDLCVQTFGDPADPAVLLISGAQASMVHFPAELCERISGAGRFVIRYDHRDTGRSVTYPPGGPPYTGLDLAEDALGVLDAVGVERAHLAGISMGGAIAQHLGIHHPGRVASLTLIATSPVSTASERDLPRMADADAAEFAALAEPDWSDPGAVVDYVFALERLCASRTGPPDDPFIRRLAEETVARANRIESIKNHSAIEHGAPEPPGALAGITAPTLVVHGTDDPLFPVAHGVALAEEIAGATLLELEGNGHELPPAVWDQVIAAVIAHTA